MPWVKLSDTFADDPRLEEAGAQALALHVAALCYCNRQLTDGKIPERTALRLWSVDNPQAAIDALVAVGLWKVRKDGFEIVGYLENQPSRAHVWATRKARAAAGAAGGRKSGESRRTKGQANGKQVASPLVEPRPVVLSDDDGTGPALTLVSDGQPCNHGMNGGLDVLGTGKPRCPLCRRQAAQ